ncbi:MAG: peptidylprolyl isomerase [Pseudomonadota bacterium]|nr:peptidylprolyl isomerase [Pseudomonadota bacterium]
MKRFLIAAAAVGLFSSTAFAANALKIDTSKNCSFTINLFSTLAPKHVAQVTKLAAAGFYNGIIFHRVIPGFMAQTGDPTGTGAGGSKEPNLNAEFSPTHYKRGTVGMARTNDPNSANSQFFIMFGEQGNQLDGQYTVLGEVDEAGMKCVDQIAKGEPPANPDKMLKVTVQ